MQIQYNEIKYGDRPVLHKGIIHLSASFITIIKGESGSGKTSLFNTILDHKQAHFTESDRIVNLRISVSTQIPIFIHELTMKEHISMIKNIYQLDDKYDPWIHALNLDDVLDKYPPQLSGGEKQRFSFLLCVLQDADVYMMDEPTASVNQELIMAYLSILKELKNDNKYILIFSHDQELINNGDIVYEIENDALIEKQCISNKYQDKIPLRTNVDCSSLHIFFKAIDQGKKTSSKIISWGLVFLIGLAGVISSRSDLMYHAQQKILQEMGSNEIMIFNETPLSYDKFKNTYYSYNYQSPVNPETIEKIKLIQGVNEVEWRYDMVESRVDNDDITLPDFDLDNSEPVSLNIHNTDKNLGDVEIDTLLVSTFLSRHKQSNDIEIDFEQDGVYLSRHLCNVIKNSLNITDDDFRNVKISFPFSIPLYNTYGRVYAATGDNPLSNIYSTTVTHKTLEVSVAGILKWSNFGVSGTYENILYINRDLIEESIKQVKPKNDRLIYVMDEAWKEYYIDVLPSDITKEPLHIFEDTVWQPSAYSVFVDGIEKIPLIQEEIEKMGLCTLSSIAYQENLSAGISTSRDMFQKAFIILMFIIILFGIGYEIYQNKQDTMNVKFLNIINIPRSSFHSEWKNYLLHSALRSLLYSTLFVIAYFTFVTLKYLIFYHPSFNCFLIMIVLNLIIKVIFPIIHMRMIEKHIYFIEQ